VDKTKEKAMLQENLFLEFSREGNLTDEEIDERIERAIIDRSRQVYIPVGEKRQLKKELFNVFRRLDVLSGLLEDEDISEIMVNGSSSIFIERQGRITRVNEAFASEERLRNVIQQIVSECNRIVNETVPIVDARLSDGSRVNVVLPPIALNGAVMTIRKFPKEFFTMETLIEMESVSDECAVFLRKLVVAGYNIFISGGTGSGKTTFLNVLSNYIPATERIITIEDAAELQIQGIDNLVRLETRNANVEGENAITMSQLIKTALRMRPDRIIVGEVRDASALDMVTAMLSGHDGSLSTGHSDSCREIMLRLETMILMGYEMPVPAIRQQLAAAIDVVIQLGRLKDKSRRVLEVQEVMGVENGEIIMNPLFEFKETGFVNGRVKGQLTKVGELKNTKKMEMNYIE
jgi:pilus assembly protein CpaF